MDDNSTIGPQIVAHLTGIPSAGKASDLTTETRLASKARLAPVDFMILVRCGALS